MSSSWSQSVFAKGRPGRKASRKRRTLSVESLEIREVLAAMFDVAWLGTLSPTDNFSAAQGLNDLGQVVGNSYIQDENGIPTDEKAFLYTPGVGMTDLGTAGATGAFAADINDSERVAGWVHQGGSLATGGYWEWAAIWDPDGGYTLPGYSYLGMSSVAYGVNDLGVVVGNASVPGQVPNSEAYTFDGSTLTFLGTLGGSWSYATDINNSNYVAGFADTGENPSGDPDVYMSRYHAAIWSPDGTITDLGTLGEDSYAYKINASGQVVGSSLADDGFYHAFLYDGTQMIDIGEAGRHTQALAINDAGQVVGDRGNWLDAAAFLYENGITYDLNDLVIGLGQDTLMSAHDINNLGQIVGYGWHNGRYEAFLLTPEGVTPPVTPPTDPAPTDPTPTDPAPTDPSTDLTAGVSGPTDGYDGVTGQKRTLVLEADGPLAADGFEFRVDWGDGSYDALNGASGITASHVYEEPGVYAVAVTATDSDDQTSDPATLDLTIHAVEQQGEVLAIGGTSEDDVITLAAGATPGTVETSAGTFSTNLVMVYGHDGSDQVVVQGTAGNDTFGVDSDMVDVNGVVIEGADIEDWTAEGLAGDDAFYAIGDTLPIRLQGGDGNDRFRVAADAVLDGTADGGAGSDILDYAIYQNPATVNLQTKTATALAGFASIEGFVGSNLVDSLIGSDSNNTWTMTDHDTGSVGAVQFRSFEYWTGGAGDDAFKLVSAGGLYGVLDGGAGVNTLDYSAYATGVTVDLAAGAATSIRGGVANIDNVFGGAGADILSGDAGDNLLLGNAGDDVLSGGPGGNDVLVGGAGSDTLTGSAGRNILIGGLGADTLIGGGGEDILIGGTTKYDANAAALASLMAEWSRADLTYQQRIDHLTGRTRGGANGSLYLTTKTVKDDKTADRLTGAQGLDWFWGQVAEITDITSGERRN